MIKEECPFCERVVEIIIISNEENKLKCSFCRKEWINSSNNIKLRNIKEKR